jgi:hypothetical protein
MLSLGYTYMEKSGEVTNGEVSLVENRRGYACQKLRLRAE